MRVCVLLLALVSLVCVPSALASRDFGATRGRGGLPELTHKETQQIKERLRSLQQQHANENHIITRGPKSTDAAVDVCLPTVGQCPFPYVLALEYLPDSDFLKQNIVLPGYGDLGFSPYSVLSAEPTKYVFFKLPYSWLTADCQGNPAAAADVWEFILALVQPQLSSWALTLFCKAHLPCMYCYDLPSSSVVAPNGRTGVFHLPEDAKLQKTVSFGWWYVSATLRPVLASAEQIPIDVVATIFYYPYPKFLQEAMSVETAKNNLPVPDWWGVSEAIFSVQIGHEFSVKSDSLGSANNAFNGTRGSAPWHATYAAAAGGFALDFKLLSGQAGMRGAKYAITGTNTDGANVNLVGRAVGDATLQGGTGSSGIAGDSVVGESPFAGSNCFSVRLDITGSVTVSGQTTAVKGEADFDFQYGHGNPNPANPTQGWIWYNFRLPGQCNLFASVFRDKITNEILYTPETKPSTTLQAPHMVGGPVKQKQLGTMHVEYTKTWWSETSEVMYPSETIVTIPNASGALWAKFKTRPRFENAEFEVEGHPEKALWEGGITVEILESSAEFRADCHGAANEEGVGLGFAEYAYYGLGTPIQKKPESTPDRR